MWGSCLSTSAWVLALGGQWPRLVSWALAPGVARPLSALCFLAGIDYKTTTILLDGRRVKLELW